MKPKVLLIYAASKTVVFPMCKYLSEYFDIDAGPLIEGGWELPFHMDLVTPNLVDTKKFSDEDLKKYDLVLGFDPSALEPLIYTKKLGVPVGCMVLDIPFHSFINNRNYNSVLHYKWSKWTEFFKSIDFVISWRSYTDIFGIPHLSLFTPTEPVNIDCSNFSPLRQVCYSGIVRPDKGVHNIIEAVSLIENIPRVVVVGGGADLSYFAKWLNVPYERVTCSEEEKYKIYASSLIVSYSDSSWIPPLSPLEAISIGKMPIVPDWPEYRRLYDDYAFYVRPNCAIDLASQIQFCLSENYRQPKSSEDCINFWKTNRSYTAFTKLAHEFIQQFLK